MLPYGRIGITEPDRDSCPGSRLNTARTRIPWGSFDPEEVLQAAKYAPYLEILFGRNMDIVPALVLTRAADLFEYVPIGGTDYVLPVCSGDMLFNVLNEYLGFLQS